VNGLRGKVCDLRFALAIGRLIANMNSSRDESQGDVFLMAFCRYPADIVPAFDEAFDAELEPGISAPWPGIYQCRVCECEVVVLQGAVLPSHGDRHEAHEKPIRWRLSVFPGFPKPWVSDGEYD
jgi:hypothetical protein